jgi:hypothetical protein
LQLQPTPDNNMAGWDASDPWDDIANIEGSIYEAGIALGRIESATTADGGMFAQGKQSGFLKGFAVGLELGFMERAVAAHLDVTSAAPAGAAGGAMAPGTGSDAPTATISLPSASRITKRRLELAAKAAAVPNTNTGTVLVDFDQEILDLRGLYRQCGATAGPFLPKKMADEVEAKSQAW